jgi:hypothetical protein
MKKITLLVSSDGNDLEKPDKISQHNPVAMVAITMVIKSKEGQTIFGGASSIVSPECVTTKANSFE